MKRFRVFMGCFILVLGLVSFVNVQNNPSQVVIGATAAPTPVPAIVLSYVYNTDSITWTDNTGSSSYNIYINNSIIARTSSRTYQFSTTPGRSLMGTSRTCYVTNIDGSVKSNVLVFGDATPSPSPRRTITPTATVIPTPASYGIPGGQIEAEKYIDMYGVQTETCSEGGLDVCSIHTGDWMDYNVNISGPVDGYWVQFRVASNISGGQIQLKIGNTVVATASVPNTGGLQNWTSVTVGANLKSFIGSRTLRLYAGSGGFNVNWIKTGAGPVYIGTPTPTTVITMTPTPYPTTGPGIKVQMYNTNISATTNQIGVNFKIINVTASALILSNVKLRYYYTIDGVNAQNFYCDYAQAGSSNVTGTFVTLDTPKIGADTYLEVGFTSGAGTLGSGSSTVIQLRFAKSDWTNYTQTNDYSFNSSAVTYVDWSKVTVYYSGLLYGGLEP